MNLSFGKIRSEAVALVLHSSADGMRWLAVAASFPALEHTAKDYFAQPPCTGIVERGIA